MAKGVKHYFKTGKEHKGATHKDAKERVETKASGKSASDCKSKKVPSGGISQ